MKTVLFLALGLFATSSYAGTATFYRNSAMGFNLIVAPMSENINICNYKDECIEFAPLPRSTFMYEEVTGKCRLSMFHFTKSFARGKTKNDFMLDITAQIVEVVKGEDNCQLEQENLKQLRSLTGVYGL